MGMLPCQKEEVKVVLGVLIVFVWSATCLAETISASFVFGDSLYDVGNNNYITSLAKANYPPNGIDFGKPTGRFTNGRTVPDILGLRLGLEDYTPPYLAPTTVGPVILKGVNYASGGAGILNETGKIFVGRINMDEQLDNFANTRHDIISQIGESATQDLFSGALFSITMGSNDFLTNYLSPVLSKLEQKLVSPEEFVGHYLIPRYKGQLKRLYVMGARKIVVANVGPIGCIPNVRDTNSSLARTNECVGLANHLANIFNNQLKGLLQDLNNSLEGSTFVYADVNRIFEEILDNFKSYGFDNADSACCRLAGKHGGIVPCGPPSKVCADRSKYVFWDPYHPSDNVNKLIAERFMSGDTKEISPTNLRTLFKL
ncbi:GDSL esterase/lipase At4g16230-like [Bidens hawaiensis]|uniref:GDSL esterase/lipase At4g16230-like n=1 Tax=Bidens hawaiensis TaxID=980011 RepID=UPI00404A98AB